MINPIPYLESKRIEYHLPGEKNVTRGWVNIPCPFPNCGDPSWHCGINLESGMFHCYICGAKGHLTKLLSQLEKGKTHTEIESLFKTHFKGSNTHEARSSPPTPYNSLNKNILPAEAKDLFPDLHRDYLVDRGFDPDRVIPKYGLKACANLGRYKFRIVIPYFLDGQVVTFTARDVTGRGTAYKDCPLEGSILPVKETLYNIDSVKDRVLVLEGPMDVWRIGDGSVATSTDNYSTKVIRQLEGLRERGVRTCFVMYDAEDRAIQKAERLSREVMFDHLEVLRLSSPSDPGEMSEGDVRHLRKELGL